MRTRTMVVLLGLLLVLGAAGAGLWLFFARSPVTTEALCRIEDGMMRAEVESHLGPADQEVQPEPPPVTLYGPHGNKGTATPPDPGENKSLAIWAGNEVVLLAWFDADGRVVHTFRMAGPRTFPLLDQLIARMGL